MKRFLLFTLIFMLVLSSISALCANDYITVIIDGVELIPKDVNGNIVRPLLEKGTTYLPVRAVANAFNLDIQWDDHTKTVFINGVVDSEKGENVNVYINGNLIIPKDVNGNIVNPILKDGTTYLPIRAISEELNKEVSWEQETHTVILTSKDIAFNESQFFAFVNKANGKAISLTDNGLVLEHFGNYDFQGFKITKAEDGFYYITANNDKNFDVNGNSKNPGAKIITYNQGTADNQKFAIEKTNDGYIIYAKSSLLPIEDSAGVVRQNEKRESLVQKWDIIGFTPTKKQTVATTYFLSLDKDSFLMDIDGLKIGTTTDNPNPRLWSLTPNTDGEYIITSVATGKSLDVANNSTVSGDPIITYQTSGDANQRWLFEKQEDGTYLIKSVHSNLYLSTKGGELIHAELNESLKQKWTLSVN